MQNKLAKFILRYPKSVILVSFFLTLILASGARKLRIDDNLKDMLPPDMPVRKALNKIEDIFGGSDVILLAIGNEQDTIFNQGTLEKIKQLNDSLEAMPGIRDVTSLVTLKHIAGEESGLEVTPFMEEVPQTQEEINTLKRIFFEDDTYVGQIVSEDSKYTAVIGLVDKDADEFRLYDEVKALAAKFRGPEEIHLAGFPVLRAAISQHIKLDLRRLIPFVILVIMIILYLSFRTFPGVFLPLLTVLMATVSTVGLMGHLKKPFMLINNTLPVMLMAIGTAYGIHLIARYYEAITEGHPKKEALEETAREVAIPVIIAGLTTMAGFMSLLITPLPKLAEFGLFAAFGVFMALLFSLTMIPALLILLPAPKRKAPTDRETNDHPDKGIFSRVLFGLSAQVVRLRVLIIISGALLALAFSLGIPRVKPEMNPITFFKKKSEIRKSDAIVNRYLGGSVNMNLLLAEDIENPDVLKKMEKTQEFLEQMPEISSTISMATIIKKINKALHADDLKFEIIPETKEAVSQAILLYSMSGSPQDFERLVDSNYKHGQVIARMKSVSTTKISQISREAERYCASLPEGKNAIQITGFSVLMKDLAYLVTRGQATSFLAAIIVIFLVASATYRSLKIGLLAIIPLAITIIMTFGLMGYAGIAFSIPTAIIANIIIGCGDDYSLHFISRYRLELKKAEPTLAVARTIQRVGRPILYNAISMSLGFLVLLFSGFMPLQFVGFLIALAMLTCGFGSLTVLAAAISLTKKRKEVLR